MARIPDAEVERLRKEIPLAGLLEAAGIGLEKRGKNYAARCPFHEDATASLIVTPEKNLFHCFGCGVAGGPIDWVMKRNGVSFRHAALLLREGVSPASAEPVKRTIRAIQALLGHASLSTTQVYTQVSILHLKAVHERTHPARLDRTPADA
jgi:DNA primase